jgi:formylglycine-generating enzyme required for sulfatase activity
MSGNVWEWCLSEWTEPYNHKLVEQVDIRSQRRVLRGGSWLYVLDFARVTSRFNFDPDYPLRGNVIGFRIARSL